jgi:hypothetical protein
MLGARLGGAGRGAPLEITVVDPASP